MSATASIALVGTLQGATTPTSATSDGCVCAWTATGPGPVTFDNPTSLTPNASFTVPGSYVAELSVSLVVSGVSTVISTSTASVTIAAAPPAAISGFGGSVITPTPGTLTIALSSFAVAQSYAINPSSYTIVSSVSHGTLVNNGSGSFTYTPNTEFAGNDTFTFTVSDVEGNVSNVATIVILVNQWSYSALINGTPYTASGTHGTFFSFYLNPTSHPGISGGESLFLVFPSLGTGPEASNVVDKQAALNGTVVVTNVGGSRLCSYNSMTNNIYSPVTGLYIAADTTMAGYYAANNYSIYDVTDIWGSSGNTLTGLQPDGDVNYLSSWLLARCYNS